MRELEGFLNNIEIQEAIHTSDHEVTKDQSSQHNCWQIELLYKAETGNLPLTIKMDDWVDISTKECYDETHYTFDSTETDSLIDLFQSLHLSPHLNHYILARVFEIFVSVFPWTFYVPGHRFRWIYTHE